MGWKANLQSQFESNLYKEVMAGKESLVLMKAPGKRPFHARFFDICDIRNVAVPIFLTIIKFLLKTILILSQLHCILIHYKLKLFIRTKYVSYHDCGLSLPADSHTVDSGTCDDFGHPVFHNCR
jgi:hypothetical protein